MMKEGRRYWIVYKKSTDQVEAFTTRSDACKSIGLNTITLWRHEKVSNHYDGDDFLVLFAMGVTKNVSRVSKGKALSQGRFSRV